MIRPIRCFGIAGAVMVLLLAAWTPAQAQLRPVTAEVVQATGRVELLRLGQTQWVGAAVGARLGEGDQIRALASGSSELAMPDGSTVLVAENTRFVVTKLEFDAQSRERNMAFHLVAGRVRAQVSRAAVRLVRARQSNFAISTPAGVAAVRGTIIVQIYNPATGQAATFVLPSPGQDPATAEAVYVDRATGISTIIRAGQFVTQTGTNPPLGPTPISNLSPAARQELQTVVNQATANDTTLTAPTVAIVSPAQIQALLAAVGITPGSAVAATIQVIPTTPVPFSFSSVGRDLTVNQQQWQQCASPPCP